MGERHANGVMPWTMLQELLLQSAGFVPFFICLTKGRRSTVVSINSKARVKCCFAANGFFKYQIPHMGTYFEGSYSGREGALLSWLSPLPMLLLSEKRAKYTRIKGSDEVRN